MIIPKYLAKTEKENNKSKRQTKKQIKTVDAWFDNNVAALFERKFHESSQQSAARQHGILHVVCWSAREDPVQWAQLGFGRSRLRWNMNNLNKPNSADIDDDDDGDAGDEDEPRHCCVAVFCLATKIASDRQFIIHSVFRVD